jgi:hypothetical protein
MTSLTRFLKIAAFSICLALTVSACAASRSVIDVTLPEEAAPAGNGPYVKIVEISDLRKFEVNPKDPSLPSLGDAAEIKDAKLTSRAVARKRNGYGMAMGDVVLPEGKNVVDIVRSATRTALQEKGYTVVDAGSPNYDSALPLAVYVEQFWAWFTPGFWQITLQFDSRLALKSEALVQNSPTTVNGKASATAAAAFESTWTEVIRSGINDLTARIKERIKAPSEVRQPAPAGSASGVGA